MLNQADLLLNDGIGIDIAARLRGIKLKANMNGSDFSPKVLELACKHKKENILTRKQARCG